MGLRFRKSVKAGPVRVNFSKSGVGYSVGGKGFRHTKMANGRKRNTYSIPGTGISYVSENSKNKKKNTSTNKTLKVNIPAKINYDNYSYEQLEILYNQEEKRASKITRNIIIIFIISLLLLIYSYLQGGFLGFFLFIVDFFIFIIGTSLCSELSKLNEKNKQIKNILEENINDKMENNDEKII